MATKKQNKTRAAASTAFALRRQKRQKAASGFFAHVRVPAKKERAGVIKMTPGDSVEKIAQGQTRKERHKWATVAQAYNAGSVPADRELVLATRVYLTERWRYHVGVMAPGMVKPETKRLRRLARDIFGLSADEIRRQYWLLGAMVSGKYTLTALNLLIVQIMQVHPQVIITDERMPKPAMGRQKAVERLAHPAK